MYYLFLLLFLFRPVNVHAYLDPGTGSLLLYALVGIATTIVFAVRNAWYSLRTKLAFGKGLAVSKGLPDIVFHSEGGKYWQTFEPVIAALSRRGVACGYVTPDPKDPAFALGSPAFQVKHPGSELLTIAFMNSLSAAMVVSTTPHLDVYQLRRSKKVAHYSHLFHSPTDIAFNEKYAFDYYDSLLTVGAYQEASVRQLETRRRLPAKALYPTGCPYYDVMLEELRALPRDGGPPAVLYAPTWGQRSSVLKFGSRIIDVLAAASMRVIFRPHPQFYISHAELFRKIERNLVSKGLVEIDRKRSGVGSMLASDIMITDLSGILFDYAFLLERPVILANWEADVGGHEGEDMTGELWDIATSKRLATCIDDASIEGLPSVVRRSRESSRTNSELIKGIRDGSIYNFGTAGEAAATNIMAILEGIR